MRDVWDNELLSAYVDGELTPQQQAQVERLLADDFAARQLVDELRAISGAVQSLPRYQLGEDLRDWVLREAQRRSPPRAVAGRSGLRRLGEAVVRTLVRPRNLAWAALATAIALMLYAAERGMKARTPQQPAVARQSDTDGQSSPRSRPPGRTVPSIAPLGPEHETQLPEPPSAAPPPATVPTATAQAPVAQPMPSIELTPDQHAPGSVEIICQVNPQANWFGRLVQVLARRGLLPDELARAEVPWQRTADEMPKGQPSETPVGAARKKVEFVVELEASWAEVQNLLADLKARPEEFVEISVPPDWNAHAAEPGQSPSPLALYRARLVLRAASQQPPPAPRP